MYIIVDAYPVENFRSRARTDTSFTFSWTAPRIGARFIVNYRIVCEPLMLLLLTRQSIVRASRTSAVMDFHPGTSYNCSIFTVGQYGTSEPQLNTISTPEAGMYISEVSRSCIGACHGDFFLPAPSGAPEIFQVEVAKRDVEFTWSPPPPDRQNGVITNYTLICSPSPSSLPQSISSQFVSLTVAGFSTNTLYSCSLVASNSRGTSPPATVSFTTKLDCKISRCHINGDYNYYRL